MWDGAWAIEGQIITPEAKTLAKKGRGVKDSRKMSELCWEKQTLQIMYVGLNVGLAWPSSAFAVCLESERDYKEPWSHNVSGINQNRNIHSDSLLSIAA